MVTVVPLPFERWERCHTRVRTDASSRSEGPFQWSPIPSVVPLVVTIPPADSSSQIGTPTGQVFNGTNDFQLAPGMPALFIFVTEDGTVSGWNPGVSPTSAVIKVNTKRASVFKVGALATATTASGRTANFLYVADFRKGHVKVGCQ
jgi:hypothetical protein